MSKYTRLQTLLDVGVHNYPDKTALYFASDAYSYQQLGELSRKLARGLQQNGVVSGDRVAIFLPNCPEAVMMFLACYMIWCYRSAIKLPLPG